MTDPKMDHVAEAEGYLRDLDSLDPPDAYVAVVAAQAHATLAQGLAAQQMVDLQRQLLASMLPPSPTPQEQVREAMEEAEALARAMPGPEEQVKPAIEEPTEFGSIVRATIHGAVYLWQRSPVNGKHYWESDTGAVEVWSELTDVEVLRVGIGETGNGEDYRDGFSEAKLAMRQQLRNLRAEALTAERQNAYDKAIAVVKEIQP